MSAPPAKLRRSRIVRLMLGVLLCVLGVVLVHCASNDSDDRGPATPSPSSRSVTGPASTASPTTSSSQQSQPLVAVQGAETARRPVAIDIPSEDIHSRLDTIDVGADGILQRPRRWDRASWYVGGPRPGDLGPAVIAGHVDSFDGPAVFAALSQIAPGALVTVTEAGGDTVRFRVDRLTQAPKKAFPTHAVYGPTPDAQLRLITCDGAYDSAAGGYQDNLIVFATKVSR